MVVARVRVEDLWDRVALKVWNSRTSCVCFSLAKSAHLIVRDRRDALATAINCCDWHMFHSVPLPTGQNRTGGALQTRETVCVTASPPTTPQLEQGWY
jgi:hypothetical protein